MNPAVLWMEIFLFIAIYPPTWANPYEKRVQSHPTHTASPIASIAQRPADTQVLEPGKPIERELAGGQTHAYQVRLTTGQYVHVVVQQRGIDLATTAFAQDGTRIINLNSREDTQGPEPISLVAEVSGSYRIEVHTLEKGGRRGHYVIRLEVLRTASEQDRKQHAAQASFAQGEQLRLQGKAESRRNAIPQYEEALHLYQAAGDREGEANTLSRLGQVYYLLGEVRNALEAFSRELPLRQASADRSGEASAFNKIGVVRDALGEREKALEYYNQALPLRRAVGDRRGEASTLNNMGIVYKKMGRLEEALEYYGQVLPLYRALEDQAGQAVVLHNIGSLYDARGERQKALDYYNQALPLSRAVGDRRSEAGELYLLARAELDLDRLAEAHVHIESALQIVESLRLQIGALELRASYLAGVHQVYELYIDLLLKRHRQNTTVGYDAAALQISEAARARSLLELLSEARADLSQGADPKLLERERSLREALNGKTAHYIYLLNNQNGKEKTAAVQSEIETLTTDHQQVQAQIRATSPRYAALTQPQPIALPEIQGLLDGDTLLLEYALGDVRSYLLAITSASITTFELPKRSLVEEAAAQVFKLLTARDCQPKSESKEARSERLRQADRAYPEASAALSRMLLGPAARQLAGKKRLLIVADGALYYIPFAALPLPASQQPGAAGRKALGTGRGNQEHFTPLVLTYEIINLPSASALDLLRRDTANRPPAPNALAILANPVFKFDKEDPRFKNLVAANPSPSGDQTSAPDSGSLKKSLRSLAGDRCAVEETEGEFYIPSLGHSEREARAISRLVPGGTCKLALGFDANYETATSAQLGDYRIIHFATHGLLDSNKPELSGILLSLVDEQGREKKNGLLGLGGVYGLRLNADLVVLSASQTALGEEVKGEGLIGLTRGLMYAGAARVLASLWRVDDEATAKLMVRFYEGMLKDHLNPAAALRKAQIAMWQGQAPGRRQAVEQEREWSAPYYWSAFTLQGEWR